MGQDPHWGHISDIYLTIHNYCVRNVAGFWTDHARSVQFQVREVYCGGKGQKGAKEMKGEKRDRRSRGSAFYLGCDVAAGR